MSKMKLLIVISSLVVTGILILVFFPLTQVETFANRSIYSEEVKKRFATNNKIIFGFCDADLLKPKIYSIFDESEESKFIVFSTVERSSYFSQSWSYDYLKNAEGSLTVYEKDITELKEKIDADGCNKIKETNNDNTIFHRPQTKEEIEQFEEIKTQEIEYQNRMEEYQGLSTEEKLQYKRRELEDLLEEKEQLSKGTVTYKNGEPIPYGDLNSAEEKLPLLDSLIIPDVEAEIERLEKQLAEKEIRKLEKLIEQEQSQ